ERVKELDCLYSISFLAETLPVEAILDKVVRLIPSAWQYPDRACARVLLADTCHATDNWQECRWIQTAGITIEGKEAGRIEVGYRDLPGEEQNPFLREESALLNAIALNLARVIERKRAEEAIRRSEEQYRNLAKHIPGTEVLLFDTALQCTLVDGALTSPLGKSAVEGGSLQEAWAGSFCDEVFQHCQAALRG